ncbi:Rrf2 family protein [Herbaspirillum sp. Sphag1AN]|uniref:Rrf2 family transcriptional regulator n=1 Tax=unclassified Herbaspirillum TaxID=2624150 RepID=UPI00160DDF9B|nr:MULTISPECIES: Rrf2 family transcriptional regulator [unclassified Herbaspirillum]MBB3211054.1 Rrf2 family protein [Herbaspirillum sp. Sphag1AN]MBB3244683.1 Rrf2 family protein [Herbaspirillum sp. Sphag64]
MKSSRFAVAAHILVSIEHATRDGELFFPSSAIAASVNTNAVFVRELLCQLSKAHLVVTKEGRGGGAQLARPASQICLSDVYLAVEQGPVLKPNTRPKDVACRVSCSMDAALQPVLSEVEAALLKILKTRKLSELVNRIPD